MPRFLEPRPLESDDRINGFECGVKSLDVWLVKHARAAAGAESARTYVVVDTKQDRAVGYHALTVASIEHVDATARARKGMPKSPIPAVLISRLAVDRSVQGKGLGAWLLQDALTRALSVAEQAGMRLVLVHALDDAARRFYEHFGFEHSPSDSMNLQIITKDIRASLESED